MLKVMCNASPIIGLSMLNSLQLLWELFDVTIPEEVYREVVLQAPEPIVGSKELRQAVAEGKVKVYTVLDKALINKAYGILHRGELEVSIGALELDIKVVIIDEKAAQDFAEKLNLKPLGIVGVLRLVKHKGLIESIKPFL
jgi:predicted nucleic acid-binding protein